VWTLWCQYASQCHLVIYVRQEASGTFRMIWCSSNSNLPCHSDNKNKDWPNAVLSDDPHPNNNKNATTQFACCLNSQPSTTVNFKSNTWTTFCKSCLWKDGPDGSPIGSWWRFFAMVSLLLFVPQILIVHWFTLLPICHFDLPNNLWGALLTALTTTRKGENQ
jgi:hypothetical protein